MRKALTALIASLFVASGAFAEDAATLPVSEVEPAKEVATVDVVEPAVDAAVAEPFAKTYEAVPEVVAKAYGEPILTREQVLENVKPAVKNALDNGAPITEKMVNGFIYQVAESMALRNLLLAEARKEGITGDQQVAIENLKKIKEAAEKQGGVEAFQEQLKSLGKTEDDLLELLLEESMIEKFSEIIDKKANAAAVMPTDEDVKKFYDENQEAFAQPATYSASHILIGFPSQKPTDEEKAAALAKATEVKGMLDATASNFGDLAKEYSACPSKENGGALGEFPEGAMVPEFEAAVKKLADGEVSDPVETIFGYHIIKAGPMTPATTASLDDAKEQIFDFLKNMAIRDAAEDEIEKLRDSAKLEILLPEPEEE